LGGRQFVLTHGTIAYKEPGDALSRRISVAIAMTPQRGYLLIWLFAAPHEAELRELMATKIGFEDDAKPASAATAAGGGGEPAEPTAAAPAHSTLLHAGEAPAGQTVPEAAKSPKLPN